MRNRFIVAAVVAFFGLMFGHEIVHAATCTGENPCKACSSCRYCKRCAKDGKTCGTCKKSRSIDASP